MQELVEQETAEVVVSAKLVAQVMEDLGVSPQV